jgi:hypothetical protein
MPKRETPKYDLNGDLAWHVSRIEESRKVQSDDGGPSVEFRVSCILESDPLAPYRQYPTRTKIETITSWEAVSVLHSARARWDIVQFYADNRTAFGKQETREIWKLCSEDDEKVARQHAGALKQLDILIKREVARLEHDAKVEKQKAKAAKTLSKPTTTKKGASGPKTSRRR